MNPLSCADVAEQIELYALHECDPTTGAAVAQHLAGCLACARAYREAGHMLMLLDLTERGPALLGRLETRIAAQARQVRPPHLVRPPVRRTLALAAMLLITLGLGWLLVPAVSPAVQAEKIVAFLTMPVQHLEIAPAAVPGVRAMRKGPLPIDPGALERARVAGRPLPPPATDLALRLQNRGDRDLVLDLRRGRYDFFIDLHGPGVVRLPARPPADTPFATPGLVRVPPGGSHLLHVQRLSEIQAGNVNYVYWTKPGRYTLSVRLLVSVGAAPPRVWTVVTPPISVEVSGPTE
jgi:anti-sigma factor RsiW